MTDFITLCLTLIRTKCAKLVTHLGLLTYYFEQHRVVFYLLAYGAANNTHS